MSYPPRTQGDERVLQDYKPRKVRATDYKILQSPHWTLKIVCSLHGTQIVLSLHGTLKIVSSLHGIKIVLLIPIWTPDYEYVNHLLPCYIDPMKIRQAIRITGRGITLFREKQLPEPEEVGPEARELAAQWSGNLARLQHMVAQMAGVKFAGGHLPVEWLDAAFMKLFGRRHNAWTGKYTHTHATNNWAMESQAPVRLETCKEDETEHDMDGALKEVATLKLSELCDEGQYTSMQADGQDVTHTQTTL